ncbi:MAG: DUF2232 domain-containing protein [Alphaproteobacteria bacterium]
MGPTIAVAFGAGLASALLFASLATGNPLAFALFYFAALPVLIAGLGWGAYAGAFAGAIGALALSLFIGSRFGLAFFFSVGFPAWILAHLVLSWREPKPDTADDGWMPSGHILAAIGVGGVALTLFGIVVLFGIDYDTYRAALRQMVERTIRITGANGGPDMAKLAPTLTAVLPLAGGVVWTFVTALNLFLAARIVRASDRLVRPWPDLPSLKLPLWTVGGLLIGSLGSFFDGLFGHIAGIVLAIGLAVYSLAGLALVHDLTRGWAFRGPALGVLYALTILNGWPLIFVALAALADVLFDLRGRRQPPPPTPT